MSSIDLLLVHALIVTQDQNRTILPDGAIAIREDRILALGPTAEIEGRFRAAKTIDLTGQVVFPGLVNTHDHLFQVATKGLGEDMPVHHWVDVVTGPTAVHIRPEEMYLFCLNGCLELLHSGVTTVADMSYRALRFDLHDENIRAIQESGLRGRYTTIITDYGLEYGIPQALISPIEWYLEEYERLIQKYPPKDRLAIWIAIGAPWTISEGGIKKMLDFSLHAGIPVVMHINENYVDNEDALKRFGKKVVPYLEEIGFLRPELLAIHCVEMEDRDIELFARRDVKVSHNPVSNMYLGSGIPPILKMQQAGLTISLGVDGAGSNNSQDMIETMKFAALLQKVAAKDASVVDAQRVLDWATLGGAKALGLEKEIGSLEPGKQADLFVIAPNTSKITPIHDPVATLVYSCGEENVVMTMAGGKVLVRDGVVRHINEAEVVRGCQEAALALADRCGSNSKVKRSWRGNRK